MLASSFLVFRGAAATPLRITARSVRTWFRMAMPVPVHGAMCASVRRSELHRVGAAPSVFIFASGAADISLKYNVPCGTDVYCDGVLDRFLSQNRDFMISPNAFTQRLDTPDQS